MSSEVCLKSMRKKRKQKRKMTDTEYRGYMRYHGNIEDPEFRELQKTVDSKKQYSKKQKRLSADWKSALKNENTPTIENLEANTLKLQKNTHGIHTRKERLKKLENYEAD